MISIFSIKTHIDTNISVEQVVNLIKNKLKPSKGIWSRNILSLYSNSNPLRGVINVPFPISDPFKNHISITINEKNNFSSLKIKLHFGILIILSLLIFPMIVLITSGGFEELDFVSFGISLLFSLFLYLIFRLKLSWDYKRVTNWLIEECNIRKLNK